MSKSRVEKDKQRAAKSNNKQQPLGESPRHETTRKKVQCKKKIPPKRPGADADPPQKIAEQNRNSSYDEISVDIESDLRMIVETKSSCPDETRDLEEKRQRALFQKRARVELQARAAKEKELTLDRRRDESVAMKWEDGLARAVENDARRRAELRARKARLDRGESRAIFTCLHEMKGKRFLVSVYPRNARGYDLEGLRIVAYDPALSVTFAMVMTLREFKSLGYGRTPPGLTAFCKWLCLLYEKRRRQFRLVWSGVPCPPPLRVRESDPALICIHKEGLKIRRTSADWYSLVAVYLRTDEQSTLRFVVSSWRGQEAFLAENAVAACDLISGSDLDMQWTCSGHATIVWKHNAGEYGYVEQRQGDVISSSTCAVGLRIYSSEIVVDRVKYSVHLYDTSALEYTVELLPKQRKGGNEQQVACADAARLSLDKRKVNPYGVQLSSSSFADLLSLIRFELVPSVQPDQPSHLVWKATISPKWAGKLANYVRVLRLAKYALKIGGVFCFVVFFVVQQKTEFRAHLLLELTWLGPTLSSSFALGGVATRQSLHIPLSEFLRCGNTSRRFAVELGQDAEEEDECPSCSAYSVARSKLHDESVCTVPEPAFNCSSSCSNCAMIQYRRLETIKELLLHSGALSPESLAQIYHGYCAACESLTAPIVLVLGSVLSPTMMAWLLPLLEHYFATFDCSKDGFLQFVEAGEGHSIAEESMDVQERILQTLARDQVVVLINADCGVTVASANLFVHELHWWLYPEYAELPCHVAYVVGDLAASDVSHRDVDLLEALSALNYAAGQVAELDPVRLDSGGENEGDHGSAFDAYLVAEAVLVEAARVLLHPDYAWQKPRKIVGASSWSTACSYLLDPAQLSVDLQRCDPLLLGEETAEVLEAYFAHAKWPHDYTSVRPFFYGLLAFMFHLQHVRQILVLRSGSLQNSPARRPTVEGEGVDEGEYLAKNTSVIDCCSSP